MRTYTHASFWYYMFITCITPIFSYSFALAADYREIPYTSYIQTSTTARFAPSAFGRGGFAFAAGGVVLGGEARFFLENSAGPQVIPANKILLDIDDKGVVLVYLKSKYVLDEHKDIACPLGRFVLRDGVIAFTVPPRLPTELKPSQQEYLQSANLVDTGDGLVASEFRGTSYENLLLQADFAPTDPLPGDVETDLRGTINQTVGGTRSLNPKVGSYVNTNSQIVYNVFLVASRGRVEIGGLPLRYRWRLATDGSAVVTNVESFSSDWSKGSLGELLLRSKGQAIFSQKEIVNFYQVSGVFRQLAHALPSEFRAFVSKACLK